MNSRHFQRLQPHWDWRAAGNFICGGAGAGLAFFAALGAPAPARPWLVAAGLALVGLGLFFVWLEIGRPLRAFNVFVHLRSSWMSREAVAALALFALAAGLVWGMPWRAWPSALAALVFLYCQASILARARAIPVWRHPLTRPLLIVTGLAEGLGLLGLLGAWSEPRASLVPMLAALLAGRWVLWRSWRERLAQDAAPGALQAIARGAPVMHWLGTALPIALLLVALPEASPRAVDAWLLAAAGALAAASGGLFKFTLVTRTAYHHGFSIPRMPVRGVPRVAPP